MSHSGATAGMPWLSAYHMLASRNRRPAAVPATTPRASLRSIPDVSVSSTARAPPGLGVQVRALGPKPACNGSSTESIAQSPVGLSMRMRWLLLLLLLAVALPAVVLAAAGSDDGD